MLGLDLDKAGKDAVDEVATKIVPLVEPLLDAAIDKLAAALKATLVGRKITITIE
jgi:hypothetical protein